MRFHPMYPADFTATVLLMALAVGSAGAQPVQINPQSVPHAFGQSIAITPDSRNIIFTAGDFYEAKVYVSPIEGGPLRQLSVPHPGEEDPFIVYTTPDSQRFVYRTRDPDRNAYAFSGPIDGTSPAIQLETDPVGVFDVSNTHMVYSNNNTLELFSVPLTGGDSTRLHGSFIQVSDDDQHVLTYGSGAIPAHGPLQLSRVDGSELTQLTQEEVAYNAAALSPNSTHVAYVNSAGVLKSTRLQDGVSSTISPDGLNVAASKHWGFRMTSDDQRIVFRDAQLKSGLYSAQLTNANAVRLDPPPVDDRYIAEYGLSPNSDRVVFSRAKHVQDCHYEDIRSMELFSVPVDGGELTPLSQPIDTSLAEPRMVMSFEISADGSRVVYLDGHKDCDGLSAFDLWSIPIDGGEPVRLSIPRSSTTSGPTWFQLGPKGEQVLFFQTANSSNSTGLYAVPIAGGEPVQLNVPSPLGSFAPERVQMSPDGQFVVFSQNDRVSRTVSPGGTIHQQFIANLYSFNLGNLDVRAGDFNGDGTYSCDDIDTLIAEIVSGDDGDSFDLTGDGVVNIDDLTAWRAEAGAALTASGRPIQLGDANLDGEVDELDFNLWNDNRFTHVSAWCLGEFNADGFVDVSDFNLWNENRFASNDAVTTVPEPESSTWLILAALYLCVARRPARAARRS